MHETLLFKCPRCSPPPYAGWAQALGLPLCADCLPAVAEQLDLAGASPLASTVRPTDQPMRRGEPLENLVDWGPDEPTAATRKHP